MNKKVLVTGGAGYCGSILVPDLLKSGFEVTVLDTLWFGSKHLPLDHPKLTLVKGDIRDKRTLLETMPGHQTVLHLACIANDASFELDESLSTSVNFEAFEPLVRTAKKSGVQRFIYASSSSVYGVSDQPNVTEDHPLVPLTLYNKFKGMCEPILFDHTDNNFTGVVFRPATVCGFGPRQRLDLSVNILTNLAVNKGNITVFGGNQLRPNLHIKDYSRVCQLLITAPEERIQNEIFNVGQENLTISEIANLVKSVVEKLFPIEKEITIQHSTSSDLRSYHIDSGKIKKILGFEPEFNVQNAIEDLCNAFKEGLLPKPEEDDAYYNVRTMKALNIS
jgi:nucleoside-diphosphate-sugar epimerase